MSLNIEWFSFFPQCQSNRGNLPRQGQQDEIGSSSVINSLVEQFLKCSSISCRKRRSFKNVFEDMIAIPVQAPGKRLFLRSLNDPFSDFIFRTPAPNDRESRVRPELPFISKTMGRHHEGQNKCHPDVS